MNRTLDRRTFVRGITTVTVAGAIAGCSGGGGDDGGGEGGGGGGGGGGGENGGGDETTAGSAGDVPSEVSEYMSDVDNFDGVSDETGSDSVSVVVGSEANGGNFGFDPAAIKVSAGTTVTWEWNGQGGQHNVVDEDGAFESELTAEEGFTFEHTFEEAGNFRYYCSPHKSLGMKGAVIVE